MAFFDPKTNFAERSFLIVDDFEAMRRILRDLLRRCGANRVEVAGNGVEAINILRRAKYDVVLCDYYLGDGKNGQQILEEARHEGLVGPATIWIMVTAEKTHDMVMGAVEHAPDDYLLKPVSETGLLTRMERLIGHKTALVGISAAMRAKDYQKVLDLCKARMEHDAGNPMEILRIQASVYQLIGQPERARGLFEAVLARRDVPWARVGLARLELAAGETQRARDLLEQLTADFPNSLEAYDLLAQSYQQQGAWGDAQRVLTQAVRLSPNSFQRQSALGDSALRCEQFDTAESAFQKALKLGAQTTLKAPAPYLGLAQVYTAQNKTAEALKLLGQLGKDIDSEEVRLQATAASVSVHRAAGNLEQAAAAASQVAAGIEDGGHSMSAAAMLELAETFVGIGKLEEAGKLLQFLVRNNYEDEALMRRVTELYRQAGMGEGSGALVQVTRQEMIEAMNRGVKLAADGKLDEALACIRQARTLMPRNPRLLLNYAYVVIALMQKNGWRRDMETEARRSIEAAREIAPAEKRCGDLLTKLESLRH